MNMGIRAKARYEDKVLKHLDELGLGEGEEVEIETLFGAIEIEVPDSGICWKQIDFKILLKSS